MHLSFIDVAVLVIYFASLSLIGIYFSRRQTSRNEYILGSRRAHWLLAGGNASATLVSTVGCLALPGEMIHHGIRLLY